jgi:Mg-chelatase subunit ChlD
MEYTVMKAKILVLGLVLATVATVVIYPSLRGNATSAVQPRPSTQPAGKAKVEVVFVLDTTGSMGGLIDAAKEKIWSIATTLAQADPAPEITMGLIAYRDRGDAYVTKIVDLSQDLDSMYATLMDFAAEGGGDGPEDVNQALYDAVNQMSWSQDQSTYKVLFLVGDAPPHMDYQDGAKYPEIVAAAAAKGIVVNTIQCGGSVETVHPWRHIAALGNGRYFTVEQAGSAVAIASPFDSEIARLAAELDATRLYYGSDEDRARMDAKVAATAQLHESASTAAQARRGVFNATESGAANRLGVSELVHDVATGRVDLSAVPSAELPLPLVGLSLEEQSEVIEATAQRREQLQERIVELAGERDAFITGEVEELGGAADSLDRQIYEAVREQAAPKGLSYEGGPKY